MIENSKNEKDGENELAIRESMEIAEEGNLVEVSVINIEKMKNQGINKISDFLRGYEDAFRDNDFNESSSDYIKGYKYGKTGKL